MHDYTCSYYDSQQVTSDEGGQVICFGEMEQSNLDMVKVISKRHIDYVREVHILARLEIMYEKEVVKGELAT